MEDSSRDSRSGAVAAGASRSIWRWAAWLVLVWLSAVTCLGVSSVWAAPEEQAADKAADSAKLASEADTPDAASESAEAKSSDKPNLAKEAKSPVQPANKSGSVYVVEVHDTIEPGLASFLARTLEEAKEQNAAAVVLHINTPGGRVDAALEMKDALVDSQVPTYAFIKRQAYSAGALIALAADEIWVSPGAVIGAATPVTGQGEKAPEKIVSALRSAFAATAELRGRDPTIAEAMVDDDIAVEDLVDKGKLLTLTSEQALKYGFAEGSVPTLEALLQKKGLRVSQLEQRQPSLAERVARFVTNPVVAPLLMTLGMLGLLFEVKTAGWGVGGSVALLCLGLFFWGHLLSGLAGVEAIVLVLIGLVLVAVEAFVIPGFGVAGIAGAVALLIGFFLAITGDVTLAPPRLLLRAASMVSAAVLLMAVGAWVMLRYLPKAQHLSGLVLQSRLERDHPDSSAKAAEAPASLLGATGVALTDLRPAGVARIGGKRVDVVTGGEYVGQGTEVRVIEDAGYRRVVEVIGPEQPISAA